MAVVDEPISDPPAWLYLPPASHPGHPVLTRQQLLPVHELAWEDFERLCLRLQRSTLDISGVTVHGERLTAGVARMYGARGQKQHGIDIYARDPLPLGTTAPPRAIVCLQARNVAQVGEGAFVAAVDDFLKGKWASISRKFVFATSAEGVRTQHVDVLAKHSRELAALGIELEIWDRESISEMLRSQPEVVDEFFGRSWVEAFCGAEAAAGLGTRLDGHEVEQLRSQMRELYRAAFNVADSGHLMAHRRDTAPTLDERFVTLDVLPSPSASLWSEGLDPDVAEGRDSDTPESAPERLGGQEGRFAPRGSTAGDWLDVPYVPPSSRPGLQRHGVIGANEWLATASQQVLVGEPGAGKSTLLRRLVLDLLSPEPSWLDVARRWGDKLPVWLPFHFFTRRVEGASGREASVVEAIRAWFEQHDFGDLMPLIERALDDDRLLLVVDGLDEWSSLGAGEAAAAALETFVSARSVNIVMSTRPYGLDRVRLGDQWVLASMAQLTPSQQRALVTPYFNAAAGGPSPRAQGTVEHAMDEFFAEVNDSPDLSRIAGTPLFLVLLVGLRTTSGSLPARRFDVFDRAIELMITEQPSRRRVAASVTTTRDRRMTDRQLRAVMASVAFSAQARGDFRTIGLAQLESDFVDALTAPDLLALDRAGAVELASALADVAEGDLGILTRLGPNEVGFLHRSLQEQLAAEHVAARMPVEEQHALLLGHLADERWREVLLAVLRLTQRPDERAALAMRVRIAVADTPTGVAAADLLAEMVVGPYELPGDVARDLCAFLFDRVETHPLLSHRANLVTHLVGATDHLIIGAAVSERLRRWTLDVTGSSGWVLRRLLRPAGAPALSVELTAAAEALAHLSPDVAWEAARVLVLRLANRGGDQSLEAEAAAVRPLLHAQLEDPTTEFGAAATLSVVCLLWPDEPEVLHAVSQARMSPSAPVRIVALAHLLGVLYDPLVTREGNARPAPEALESLEPHDIDWLKRGWAQYPDGHSDLAAIHHAAVITVVRDDTEVRDGVLEIITRGTGSDLTAAWIIALGAYGDDLAVARVVSEHVATEKYPWPMLISPGDDLIARAYGDGSPHQNVVAAGIEQRLQAHDDRYHERQLFNLAKVDRGPRMRQILLDLLDRSSVPHWAAAGLQTQFSDDSEVELRLRQALNGAPADVSKIAAIVRPVLGEEAGRERLLRLLDDLDNGQDDGSSAGARFDFVVSALVDCSESLVDPEERERLCATAIARLPAASWPHDDLHLELAVAFSDVPTAQQILEDRKATRRPHELLAALLFVYRDDPARRLEIAIEARDHLRTPPTSVRLVINHLLAHGAAPAAFVLELCRDWADEVADEVKSIASLAYHRALLEERRNCRVSDEQWDRALEHLGDTAGSYGHDHDARRRASWIGLCVLETTAPLAGRFETIGDPAPLGVDLSDPLRGPDMVLLEQIARSWSGLYEDLGEELIEHISGRRGSGSPRALWAGLAMVAARHPTVEAELRTMLANDPTLIEEDAVLAWYAADSATSRSAATEAVLAGVTADTNLRGLAVRMAQDPEAAGLDRDLLVERLGAQERQEPPGFGDVTFECLAVLDPQRPEVQATWKSIARRVGVPDAGPATEADEAILRRLHPQTYFAVVYAAAPPEVVPWLIGQDLNHQSEGRLPTFYLPAFVRHVRHRLLTDPAALSAVRRTVADGETPLAVAVSLISLLSSVTGADTLERAAVDQCLARVDETDGVLLVRDVVLGLTVSQRVSLLHSVTARVA